MATKDIARLDARIDHIVDTVQQVVARLDQHIDTTESHRRNWIQHRGTVFGALGPILVGLFELLRHVL